MPELVNRTRLSENTPPVGIGEETHEWPRQIAVQPGTRGWDLPGKSLGAVKVTHLSDRGGHLGERILITAGAGEAEGEGLGAVMVTRLGDHALRPDLSRPGLGLTLKEPDAVPYRLTPTPRSQPRNWLRPATESPALKTHQFEH